MFEFHCKRCGRTMVIPQEAREHNCDDWTVSPGMEWFSKQPNTPATAARGAGEGGGDG